MAASSTQGCPCGAREVCVASVVTYRTAYRKVGGQIQRQCFHNFPVLPVELHQKVSIFVDIDSSEESQTTSFTAEPTPFRSGAASVPPVHLRDLENIP
ncbi:hypothetical protein COOONC_27849, partial [Cooperia oncophora]